jgi:hypothetical protein
VDRTASESDKPIKIEKEMGVPHWHPHRFTEVKNDSEVLSGKKREKAVV